MSYAAFSAWLPERILADDGGLLVVDKPSGLPTHGGDETLAGDVVGRLAEWLSAKGEDPYLGVHQRLDLGTSGVLCFVRDRALNAQVGAEFSRSLVHKRYVAGVELAARSALSSSDTLRLEHRLITDGRRFRVAPSGGKLCVADCRVVARSGQRALVELEPRTGRTHQLRVQLAAVGAPIVGDGDYGGPPGPRLLLHAKDLELSSLARRFHAPLPAAFQRWLRGEPLALGDRDEVSRKLRDAACKRYPLLSRTDALRWVNSISDELPGIEVDLYAGFASLSVSTPEASERATELGSLLCEAGASGVYLKERARADLRRVDRAALSPALPVAGVPAPEPLVVDEQGLRFAVDLGEGLSSGLFLDQRDNRARVQSLAHGARVLNLFAYTCSFSVAAGVGGARQITSVDLSGRALSRGQENFRVNGLDPALHAFFREDAVQFLERRARQGDVFDLVVLDPPSFSSSKKGKVLSVARDYEHLARLCLRVLGPAGRLLAVTNHRGTSPQELRKTILRALAAEGRDALSVKTLPSGLDCPDGPNGPAPSKSLLVMLTPERRRAGPRP